MPDIKCDIIQKLGVISTAKGGWTKELNMISWNDGDPKYDIRQWSPDHEKMGKGISLSKEEAQELLMLLQSNL